MKFKTIKFTIGSKTYEIQKKHIIYAALATTSYLAIVYKNRCTELSTALLNAEQAKTSWKQYSQFVTDHSINSGVATMVETNGKQRIVFAYDK